MSLFQIAKSIFLVLAIWMISIPAVFACSCVASIEPKTSNEKWKIAQQRIEKIDYALVGRITHISENLNPDASPLGHYVITIEPKKIAKGSPTSLLKLHYFVEGSPACSQDSLQYEVGDQVNILAYYISSKNSSKILVWQNSICDWERRYVFYENGPLSNNPRKLELTKCSKRPGIPYRCRKYLP